MLDAEFAVILDGQIVATTVEFIQALFLDGLHIQCEVARNCQKDITLIKHYWLKISDKNITKNMRKVNAKLNAAGNNVKL